MGLLQPDSGLIFWVSLAFFTVFFVLAKWGFPVIIRSLEERKKRIDSSLENAAEVERRLAEVKSEVEQLRLKAQSECRDIVREADRCKEEILAKARIAAEEQAERIIIQAKKAANEEREAILSDARSQIALMAATLSEKLLRREFEVDKSRLDIAMRLIDEVEQKFDPQNRVEA